MTSEERLNPIGLVELLAKNKIPHSTEFEMQTAIYKILCESCPGLEVHSEWKLDGRSRVDFFVDGIAIECKVKNGSFGSSGGSTPLRIFRQLERYAELKAVRALILVTAKFMSLPEEINGKPCFLVHVGRGWL